VGPGTGQAGPLQGGRPRSTDAGRRALRSPAGAVPGRPHRNPELTISFVASLPQFVGDGPGAVGQVLRLSTVSLLVTLLVFTGYG
jgi:hypothetical protein